MANGVSWLLWLATYRIVQIVSEDIMSQGTWPVTYELAIGINPRKGHILYSP